MSTTLKDLTLILNEVERGDRQATEKLLGLVHAQLLSQARRLMAGEDAHHTLEPTALVNEAYLRLFGNSQPHWLGRRHFFHVAAEAMRRILIDYARAKHRAKRGGGWHRTEFRETELPGKMAPEELLAMDEALGRLAQCDPAKAQVVRLRFYAGLGVTETAKVLDISPSTVKRHWLYARAWLRREIAGTDGNPPS